MSNSNNRIEIITLGCSKNVVDSERLSRQLKANNFEITDSSEDSDSIIINTCGFIDAAKEESINTILEAVELKKSGKVKKVVVAGCLSERFKNDLIKEIPDVDVYFGTEEYEGIVKEFGGDLKKELLGERELTTPKHFAYLKISEGCDNPCSFCAIPLMRGMHKSTPMENLIIEAESLAKKGVKELIIIGQDTTDYGKDIYGKRNLAELLNKLSKINGIEWIRLLYAYPSHFPKDLMDEIAVNPKICKYIDIPLQHISDNVLKSMRRGITKNTTVNLLKELQSKIPNLTLRTTFIIGYPNETANEFEELKTFLNEIKFDKVGVFDYSVEENTPSFILGDKVSKKIKEKRRNELMELQKEISYEKNKNLVGKTIKAIIDDIEGEYFIGRSERDAPEVDGEVLIKADDKMLKIGEFYSVEIFDCNEYDIFAKLSY
ncbi:MAG: 30S ribosomal protein S12 methylthiotransferase RimO [Ignavibacteriae bacterium]|nr:30S ribosomal protein S12 methylthiotransferase RimO [Ignavibacteriota bacterium]MCB9207217.1 30S ribosomal protein S12 methylthiotransferase RimO [Ignavibacteriales bacterium]MCB9219100.1 30S ribosomal protein S12 methylthiotransferase RimO [Ignavibacteriales bacterium]MCB9259682.1 30S ribosomal protein S12 methylthiotransferase RimO [Ignavibacteriales bacterium]